MGWRFWEPRHTVTSVARRLADGLRDGSVVLDEPFAYESDDEGALVVHLLTPAGLSDPDLLDLVKRVTVLADEAHRGLGGHGLSVRQVRFFFSLPADEPAVRVALEPRSRADQPDLLAGVLKRLSQRADLRVFPAPSQTA